MCERWVGDWTELQHIDHHSYGHQHVFPVLMGCSTGDLRPSLSGCWFSLPHLISNSSDPPNSLNFLCTQLYNSSASTQYLTITGHRNMHFRRLWNGMFYRHRAEITVMQFTGHSLPVHQFLTVPRDFNPVPYYQPSSPKPMEYALSPSFEWQVWPGLRSTYNSIFGHLLSLFLMSPNRVILLSPKEEKCLQIKFTKDIWFYLGQAYWCFGFFF